MIKRWTLQAGTFQSDRLFINAAGATTVLAGGRARVVVDGDGVMFIQATEGEVKVAVLGPGEGVAW